MQWKAFSKRTPNNWTWIHIHWRVTIIQVTVNGQWTSKSLSQFMPLPFLVLPFCVSLQDFCALNRKFFGLFWFTFNYGCGVFSISWVINLHQGVMDQKCAVMSTFMCMHIWLSILSLWKAHLTLVFTFCSDQVRCWRANLGTVLGHQLYLQPVTPTGHLVLIFQASSRNEANLGTKGSELKNCLIFARLSKMKLNLVPGFFLSSLMVCYLVSTCVI
jgi:hypothetical protein